ncbi:hypothetical protein TD95_005458 [Thielaviopsis punctulata]|uniref:Ribokinase n=1 Tax=Thielaviopsis punctulata TaxID=72032 RepID=A0A0F4Z7Q9_9PEZI|nr:hypothetical protein TD95_005458 [Thielaviopsis punctulata]
MASPPVIAVIGSLNTDLVMYTPYVPRGGETMTGHSFHTGLGGKGANQAVACAKLSRKKDLSEGTAIVRMLGAVGNDANGADMLKGLAGYGVESSGVKVADSVSTGVAIILVEDSGENRIMLSPGANYTVKPEEFAAGFPGPKPSLVIMQLEIPLETVLQCMQTAKREGVPVLLNPAPAQKIPVEYYKDLAYLVVNETEAMMLSDCDENDVKTEEGLQRVAGIFKGYGVRNVLITLGGSGVFYSAEDGAQGLVPAEKAKVVDTTAAGDTFVAAYALEIIKGNTTEQAVRIANKAAAKTVEKKGAQESIPWLDEL